MQDLRGTTGEPVRVQGSLRRGAAGLVRRLGPPLLAAGLAGCSTLDAVNPVTWWHDLEGGPIADQRPPPPNADAPYQNLGDAPTDVPPGDAAARSQVANALVADRANAKYAAELAPLAPPTPVKPPSAPASAAAPADASSASLEAASAKPPPPPKPVAKAAPATPVQTTPLAAPAAASPPAELPPVPEQPPAPPVLAGVPAATAPTPPPPTPKPAPPPPAALVAGDPVAVAFAPGSSALPSSAIPDLKQLARLHATGIIGITGYGEARAAGPDAQAAAMPLAMARVRAVAAYLLRNGVPSSALRIDGEAQGTGAIVRPIP